jgi:hypothetical protein
VIISPRWLVTAAHVVSGSQDGSVEVNGKRIGIDKTICHPLYKDESVGFNDVAVCHSEEDMVISFYPPLYSRPDEVGKLASLAGWGIAGRFDSGADLADSQRRAGSNIVDGIDRGTITCTVHEGTATKLEFLIASGDSGGGLFLGNELAGIHSFLSVSGRPPRSKAGETSHHTRISEVRGWILDTTGIK